MYMFAVQLYMHNHAPLNFLTILPFHVSQPFSVKQNNLYKPIFYLYMSFQWTSLRVSHKTRIFIPPVRTFYIISCYMEYYTNCHHFRNFTPETTLLPSKS